jgi:hypothetical protein
MVDQDQCGVFRGKGSKAGVSRIFVSISWVWVAAGPARPVSAEAVATTAALARKSRRIWT